MVLGKVAAYPILADEPKNKIVIDVVREMALAARLPEPRLYMIDDPAPNALTIGRNPADSVICVTKGLVDEMDREELQGVIAHEMAHIRSYDTRLTTLVTTTLLGSGLGILLSREREYLADAAAVEFTRNPTALIRALEQIAKTAEPLKSASPTIAPLCIVDPMQSSSAGGNRSYQEFLDQLTRIRSQTDKTDEQRDAEAEKFASEQFPLNLMQQAVSTHPPLPLRIARLQHLLSAAGDSNADASSDQIAARRSESAHFLRNLTRSDPEVAANAMLASLTASAAGRTMLEKISGLQSSEGSGARDPIEQKLYESNLESTGDLNRGDVMRSALARGLAGDTPGATAIGASDPVSKEAIEREALAKMMAVVLPTVQPKRSEKPRTAAGGKSSSFGVVLFWLVIAVSAGAIVAAMAIR